MERKRYKVRETKRDRQPQKLENEVRFNRKRVSSLHRKPTAAVAIHL